MTKKQLQATIDRALSWNARFPLLVLLAWLFFFSLRPFHLGIYEDDWWDLIEPASTTAAFSLARLGLFIGATAVYLPRPVLGLVAFLIISLTGPSAFALQCVSALLALLAALSLRAWLVRLLEPSPGRTFAADLAVVFWLAMPWMLGSTAWPTGAHNLLAQILFTEALRALPRTGALPASAIWRFGALLLASLLAYEAFYFQIFAVLAFYAACGLGPARNRRHLAALVLVAGFTQALAIGFNRWAASRGAPAKTFNAQWLNAARGSFRYLPEVLRTSVGYPTAWHYLLVCVAGVAAVLFISALLVRSAWPLLWRTMALAALSLTSIFISSAVYALAGYGFAPFGLESRVLLSVSWSLAIAFYALASWLFIPGAAPLRVALCIPLLALIFLLGVSQQRQLGDWAEAWQEELAVLARAPLAEIQQCPPGSAVLFIGPASYHEIIVFNAAWGLTPAVYSLSPLNHGRLPFQFTALYPSGKGYRWTWDGSTLSQELAGYWTQKFPAKQLFVWPSESSHLEQAQPGFHWPPVP